MRLTRQGPTLLGFVAVAVAWRQRLVDFLALRAHGELLRIPARYPNLAAQRLDGRAEDSRVHHVVLVDIVREPLMIAMRRIDLAVLVNLKIAVWHYFGAHVRKLTVSGEGPTARRAGPPTPRARRRWPRVSRPKSFGRSKILILTAPVVNSGLGLPGRWRGRPCHRPGGAGPGARGGRGRRRT